MTDVESCVYDWWGYYMVGIHPLQFLNSFKRALESHIPLFSVLKDVAKYDIYCCLFD